MTKHSLLRMAAVGLALTATGCSSSDHSTMAMPNAEMQAVLDAQASLHPKPIETLSATEARLQPSPADGAKLVMTQKGMDPTDPMDVKTIDVSYTASAGTLPARIYRPKNARRGEALPVVVYFHGGGFVIADLNTYDATPRAIAKMTNALVISIEYSHAPEYKFPAAQNDAFEAYKWVLANAKRYGGDSSRVAVMGESAGGALALATSVAARDAGIQAPVREVLVYPVAGVDMNTPSYKENADAKPLNKAMMGWFVDKFIRTDADKQDPRLDAIGKADLHRLPPTTIILAEIDPLRSDGEMLGDKLRESGVDVDSRTFDGVTHEFFGMGAVVSEAKDAESYVADKLKSSF